MMIYLIQLNKMQYKMVKKIKYNKNLILTKIKYFLPEKLIINLFYNKIRTINKIFNYYNKL